LETVQENSQGHQTFILQPEDSRNIKQGKRDLETHELDQAKKPTGS